MDQSTDKKSHHIKETPSAQLSLSMKKGNGGVGKGHGLARARTTARETTATAATAAAAAAAAAAACSGEARARWHVATHVLGMPLRVSRHSLWSDARSLLRVRVRIGLG